MITNSSKHLLTYLIPELGFITFIKVLDIHEIPSSSVEEAKQFKSTNRCNKLLAWQAKISCLQSNTSTCSQVLCALQIVRKDRWKPCLKEHLTRNKSIIDELHYVYRIRIINVYITREITSF